MRQNQLRRVKDGFAVIDNIHITGAGRAIFSGAFTAQLVLNLLAECKKCLRFHVCTYLHAGIQKHGGTLRAAHGLGFI
jgi:hypothetical protein